MTLSDIARWFWPRRESKSGPRSSASLPAKGKKKVKPPPSSASFTVKTKPPEQHKAAGHGRKWFGKAGLQRGDIEVDGFVVPPDVRNLTSGYDSDGSDWSIGWFEPLSSEFASNNDSDNSFGVLVRCYGPSSSQALESHGKQNEKTRILNMIQSNPSSKDCQKHVEKWLSSLKM